MNFVFLSPNFPKTYYNFTKGLRNNGVTTLGIGDEPYDQLSQELKDSLVEYYKVNSLENYDEVYRACAFFTFKYGKIDWLESNNEYWLLRDAQLRTDFNITTGLRNENISGIKYKSKMKAFYEKAGVPTARYHLVSTLEEGLAFIEEVGYPVIVKPDNGVGAAATYKLKNEDEVKDSLVEYYKVNSLENYDEVYRACAFFTFKYGKIDWLESNNEYWLLRDAQLRTDFNITTGLRNENISGIKYKSKMKAFYEKAGVPTARYHLVSTLEEGLAFIEEVGYPVIVKPDNGVGAAATYKLKNEDEVKEYYNNYPEVQYIMEEFINGTIVSYDGICDSNRDIIFETSHYFGDPVMDVVNDGLDLWYYSRKEIPADLKDAGRRTIKAFESNSRFFRCEFFVLNEDKEGLGKKGDIFGLEVNMRPPGGYSPDMMNFANDIDVYQIWANMVCYDKGYFDPEQRPYTCVYASRRRGSEYEHSHDDVFATYGQNILMYEEMPAVLAGAMGDFAYMARFTTEEAALAYVDYVLKKKVG